MRGSWGLGAAVLVLIVSVVTATAATTDRRPTARAAAIKIVITPSAALVDQPVDVRLTGLRAGQRVTLEATTLDLLKKRWRSQLVVHASRGGVVDTHSGMRLFWSMRPVKKPPATQALTLFGAPLAPTPITIRAWVTGHQVASAVLTRRAAANGVTWRNTTLAHEGFVGTYFNPPGASSAPAVLQIGGSEGRHSYYPGAVLASHGYPTLSLAYFKEPGLPKTLKNIPLEYFAKALRWLATQPGVDPKRVMTLGVSRGGEAALLVAATYPDLVHGAFSATGSSEIGGAFPGPGDAWTLGGKSVPYGPIPVWQIAGRVIVTAGGKDPFGWTDALQRIIEHAREHGRHDIVGRVYPTAGHGVGWEVPNMPVVQVKIGRDAYIPLGGSPAGNARGYAAAWSVLLRFIETLPQ